MTHAPLQSPHTAPLPPQIFPGQPITALAPMQDVTDLAFMAVIAHYGPPDWFFTEYFRVHSSSTLEKHIVRSITENATGRPIFAQMIGENLHDLSRTAHDLQRLPVAGVDLNMGCPAPKIYKKNVGGGLLRDTQKIDEILGCLRREVAGLFTVKTRIGFDDFSPIERVVELVNQHQVDLLSIHGRTVKELYRSDVHYDVIARAVRGCRCPVLANGNVTSAKRAAEILNETGAAGVMIGRHAIRNPWIFRQVREQAAGLSVFAPKLCDVREYIERLYRATSNTAAPELARVGKLKKYLNFIGQSVDPRGDFLREMRTTLSERELFSVCDQHLLGAAGELPFSSEPYAGVVARPNCETPLAAECSLDSITS